LPSTTRRSRYGASSTATRAPPLPASTPSPSSAALSPDRTLFPPPPSPFSSSPPLSPPLQSRSGLPPPTHTAPIHLSPATAPLLHPGPQRLVSSPHLVDHSLQRLQTHPPFQPHRRRAVVDPLPGLQLFYKPQPPLPVRQRRPSLSSHSLQPWPFPLHTSLQLLFHYSPQPLHRSFLEDAPHTHLHPERLPHSRHHLRRQQRMPSDLEKVLSPTHLLHFQHFFPYPSDDLLVRRPWLLFLPPAFSLHILWPRQRPSIHLPIPRFRHPFQLPPPRQPHVHRQPFSHIPPQPLLARALFLLLLSLFFPLLLTTAYPLPPRVHVVPVRPLQQLVLLDL